MSEHDPSNTTRAHRVATRAVVSAVTVLVVLATVVGPVGAVAAPDAGGAAVAAAEQSTAVDSTLSRHDRELQDGGTYFIGMVLLAQQFDPDDDVVLRTAGGRFVSDVVVDDQGRIFLRTANRAPDQYVLTNNEGTRVEFQLVRQEYSVTANRTSVSNRGTDTTVAFTARSNRNGYTEVVSSPTLSATTLRDAFGTGTVEDVDGDGRNELVLSGGSVERTRVADFRGVSSGTYRIDFAVRDTSAADNVSIEVGQTGTARLDTPTVVDETGDVPTVTVSLQGTSRAQLRVGSTAANYLARMTVVDGNGDGRVDVRWNTYRAGHDPEGAAFSAAHSADSVTGVVRETAALSSTKRLEAGNYELRVSVAGEQTDEGRVTLEAPVDRSLSVGTARRSLSIDQVPGATIADSSIAKGDYLAVTIRAGGLFGYVRTTNDLKQGTEAVSLTIRETEASAPPNADPAEIDVNGMRFRAQPDSNRILLWVRTDREVFEAGDEFRVTFTVGADNPYVRTEQRLQTTFQVAARQASFATAGTLRVPSAANQTLRGQSTLADGSELRVTLSGSGADAFTRTKVVEVSGGEFSASFDLSGVSPGTQFTARIESGATQLERRDGVVTRRPSITIEDQEGSGEVVTVASAYLPDGGYVVIHDAEAFDGSSTDSVLGYAGYLPPGNHSNVRFALTQQLAADTEVVAAIHTDANGNRGFDFVRTGGSEDRPYLSDGSPVTATATVRVGGGTTTTTTSTTTTPTTSTTTTRTTTTTTTVVTPPPTTTTTQDTTTTTDGGDGDGGDTGLPGFGVPAVLAALAVVLLAALARARRRDER